MVLTKDVHSGIDREKIHRKKFYSNDREKTKIERKSFIILTKDVHSWIDIKKLHRKKFYNNDREKT
jgi:hypothetical protein